MRTLLIAVVAGAGAGLAARGELLGLADVRLRWLPALALGLVLQVAASLLDLSGASAAVFVVTAAVITLAVGIANLHLVGMPVVVLGLLLNTIVLAANGAMPVRPEALATAVGTTVAEVAASDLGARHRLERPDDRLRFLGDVVPVPPLGEVVSFGDLIVAVGLTDVAFRLVRPAHRRPRPSVHWTAGPARSHLT